MLAIQCTKKLKDELKIEFADKELYNVDPLYSWHSHLFKYGRMKCAVIMNTLTRYNFILAGLKSKDFKDYERIVLEAIRENLLLDGATDEMVEKYFDKINQIIYLPTSSRPVISQMNEVNKNMNGIIFIKEKASIGVKRVVDEILEENQIFENSNNDE